MAGTTYPIVASNDGQRVTTNSAASSGHANHPVFKKAFAKMKARKGVSSAGAAKMATRACAMHDKAAKK